MFAVLPLILPNFSHFPNSSQLNSKSFAVFSKSFAVISKFFVIISFQFLILLSFSLLNNINNYNKSK
nr:MAG TPA: hypothetical protein [Caudoviricetes sp.]